MHERVLALAAMIHVAHLVRGIARRGGAGHTAIHTCLGSMLAASGAKTGPHAAHLYKHPLKLRTGLILLQKLLHGETMKNDINAAKEIIAYCAAMMSLEKKLARDKAMLGKLGGGIGRIEKQCEYFGDVMHSNVIAAIAGLYGETISTLKPRIIVHGKTEFLGHSNNTNQVRALLLSGIRAAHLWRAHGGGHLQLLLRRRALAREAERILHESETA
ncbi:MAG: high frequency lysogenization protein HflD [Mariprofundaceae bacterium]|nr:high frequency lysogenization protein HflD [Mariprofundaceae bacterium]